MPSFSDWGTILTSIYTAGVLEIQPARLRDSVWEQQSFSGKKNINGGKLQLKYSMRFFSHQTEVYHPLAGDRTLDIFFPHTCYENTNVQNEKRLLQYFKLCFALRVPTATRAREAAPQALLI